MTDEASRVDAVEPVGEDTPSAWWWLGVVVGVVKAFRGVRDAEWAAATLFGALALGCLLIALRAAYRSGYLAVLGWLLTLVAVLGLGARLVLAWIA